MDSKDDRDVERLRRLLGESEIELGASRASLDDPENNELVTELQTTMRQAITLGRLDIARDLADSLVSVQFPADRGDVAAERARAILRELAGSE